MEEINYAIKTSYHFYLHVLIFQLSLKITFLKLYKTACKLYYFTVKGNIDIYTLHFTGTG